jgi:hypothetical protein
MILFCGYLITVIMQVVEFLEHGKKRRHQVRAVELLMEMWRQDRADKGFL